MKMIDVIQTALMILIGFNSRNFIIDLVKNHNLNIKEAKKNIVNMINNFAEDKNRAVETMLRDNEWATWSDQEIARICKVSNTYVSDIRKKIDQPTVNVDSKKSYKRDGKVQTMNTENTK